MLQQFLIHCGHVHVSVFFSILMRNGLDQYAILVGVFFNTHYVVGQVLGD